MSKDGSHSKDEKSNLLFNTGEKYTIESRRDQVYGNNSTGIRKHIADEAAKLKSNLINVISNKPIPGNSSKKKDINKETTIIKSNISEHRLSLDELAVKFGTSINLKKPSLSIGLSQTAASDKLASHGYNVFKKKVQGIPWYYQLLECFTNIFNLVLLFASLIFFFFYLINPMDNFQNAYIGGTMLAISFINTGIEFYELRKIAGLLNAITDSVTIEAAVIRGGEVMKVPSTELVPGDIVKLSPGVKLVADVVLLQSMDIKVDASSLTGEVLPLERKVIEFGSKDVQEAHESLNMIFSSNIIVSGEGLGIVTRTGEETLINQINLVSSKEPRKRSPLSLEIREFCKHISLIATIVALVFFIVAVIRGRNFNYASTFAIGIILAWIPQGLPLTVTFILAVSGRRMLHKNVVVKDLHGIETLGAITLLATDKTGTLTKNSMELTEIWVYEGLFTLNSGNSGKNSEAMNIRLDIPSIVQILHISATCTRAFVQKLSDGSIKVVGSATEEALLQFAAKKLKNIDKLNDLFPKVFEIPFSSDTKYHLSIHRKAHSEGGLTLHVKGAPEVIWRMCSKILKNGKAEKITDQDFKKINEISTKMGEKGYRLISFAVLNLPGEKYPDNYRFSFEKKNFPTDNLTFVGIAGLYDPPKDGTADAITEIRGAGIKVVMITGDHSKTAASLSRSVNILSRSSPIFISESGNLPICRPDSSKSSIIMEGSVLNLLSDDDWLNIFLHEEIIFSRTLASQKLEIVKRAQALGHIVAVTGDGFNDSPALKKADIGIAMNQSGSDISKESSGMILLDDNFATAVSGIYEGISKVLISGRLVFVNLKKAIQYTLTHLVAEAIPYILFVIVPIPLTMTSTQILTIDLGFELLFTLSFGWEPAEDPAKVLRTAPRKPIADETAIFNHNRNHDRKENSNVMKSQSQLNQTLGDSTLLLTDSYDNLNSKQYNVDESQRAKLRKYWKEAKRFFSDRQYWTSFGTSVKHIVTTASEERLVDSRVLSWAYLEGGVIECLGALCTFFTVLWVEFGISPATARSGQIFGGIHWKPHSPDLITEDGQSISGDIQYEALKQAQSSFYLSILIIQLFNLMACKARDHFPIGKFLFRNEKTWLAMFAGTVFGILIVYTPPGNTIFHTSMFLNPVYLLIPISFGMLLLLTSALDYYIRKSYAKKREIQTNQPIILLSEIVNE